MQVGSMRLTVALIVAAAMHTFALETVQDAARIARRLVEASPDFIGTMATVFPRSHDLAGHAFPLQEYYAPCHANGSLSLIFFPISQHARNIMNSDTSAASITVTSEHPRASRARVSLMGNVTVMYSDESSPDIQACYLAKHRDARGWLPNDPEGAHISYWARFDPHTIYFVGGFGSSHYIGYIPLELYRRSGGDQGAETSLGVATDAVQQGPSVAGRILVNQADISRP